MRVEILTSFAKINKKQNQPLRAPININSSNKNASELAHALAHAPEVTAAYSVVETGATR